MSIARRISALAIATMLLPAAAFAATVAAKPAAAGNAENFWSRPHTVSTHGAVTINGKRIDYSADTGTLILHDKQGKPTGEMFYVAYFKRGADAARRPIAFLYNGGPGSSSVWLHMGAFGPVRVVTDSHIHTPPAPYRLVNNDGSLLDATDLVFVDAMGTGFSRILGKAEGGAGTPKTFYGVDPDGQAFAQFITEFLSKYGRWNSPKYLIGESYGTTRSAVLANILEQQDNIDLNGIVLCSTILNFDTSIDQPNLDPGINLPYALALPTYAATAWYHKALDNPPAKLHPWLDQVQTWAMGPYLQALNEGATLPRAQEDIIARQMAQYTGLPAAYILKADLRVTGPEFEQTLLLPRGETTGRLDARFSGPSMDPLAEMAAYDPQSAAISSAYTAAFNDYVRKTLHFGGDHNYKIVSNSVGNDWNLLHTPPGQTTPAYVATNVMPDLAAAMSYNPDLKVMVNAGYYDLATPYYAAWYQMQQLPMQASLQKNIEFRYYHTGHMIYVRPEDLQRLHDNIVQFIRASDREPAGR
ncbi:peptidase S10 [Metallibacterium sp.]|uniref:S10 family peptidase n=1 Tax=Metallibacterium sp. TaxID=2940281 RepID=UPI00260700B4|nr:peptidase S10 [Metallibacterium sp.]